jgi:hypothetical protein
MPARLWTDADPSPVPLPGWDAVVAWTTDRPAYERLRTLASSGSVRGIADLLGEIAVATRIGEPPEDVRQVLYRLATLLDDAADADVVFVGAADGR